MTCRRKHRAIELITDPSSCRLSMSRACLGVMVTCTVPLVWTMAWWGAYTAVSVIVPGVVASICGVYWGSTRKQHKESCDE